jgi:hypothetical protein
MRSISFSEIRGTTSLFPPGLRTELERICGGPDITSARQELSSGATLDAFLESWLVAGGYSTQRNVRVVSGSRSKFDLDLLVTHSDWRTAVSVQGGVAARIDLDLLKFIAFGRASPWSGPTYAALVVSDRKLGRNITGTVGEGAFDYLRRLCPLFYASEPDIADLLVVEFAIKTKVIAQ